MAAPLYVLCGRSRDCEVQLSDPSVSGRHARLSWRGKKILIQDLGSANGTYINGQRISKQLIRPGDEVRLGNASLPWEEPSLRSFLRRGARGDTLLGVQIPGKRFICGSCGTRGVVPQGFSEGSLKCGACGVRLRINKKKSSPVRTALSVMMWTILIGALGGLGWAIYDGRLSTPISQAAERLGIPDGALDRTPVGSPQERSIRARVAPRIVEAIDPSDPLTRSTAIALARDSEGPFRVEQVAYIWSKVRGEWRYVNDPRGDEYFAHASESIRNDYTGDCDDFAIVLASMIEAIGGETRIVMLDGDQGGHAYAEVCIQQPSNEVVAALASLYRRNRNEHIRRQSIRNIHYRESPQCPVWLNLDWNAQVPGGAYGNEIWAVAVYTDGRTETLAPNGGSGGSTTPTPVSPSANAP